MKISVLASGSKGNAAFVQLGGNRLLIDAGISARRIKNSLAAIGAVPEELDGILLTHEHQDHIGGLANFVKKYNLPVYSRQGTFEHLPCRELIADKNCCVVTDKFGIGELRIETFNILHDAAEPVGFNIYGEGLKCTFATDLGFVSNEVQQALDYSDVVILEANHDVDMLRQGSYPLYLKRRIMSNRGHLSNVDAAYALLRMKKQRQLRVVLAHLSAQNNAPDKARETVEKIMAANAAAGTFDMLLAQQDQAVSL